MKGMTPIVQNVTKMVSGFVVLFGLYITITGHLSPGGGFAGGVMLMGGAVLIVIAFGGDRVRELAAENRCHILDGIGAMGFLVIALVGLWAGEFFVNFLPPGQVHHLLSGGTIPLSNIAIGIKVAAGLIGIFLALVLAIRRPMRME